MHFYSSGSSFPTPSSPKHLSAVNVIIGICTVVFLFSLLAPATVNYFMGFYTGLAQEQPWRAVTAAFVHSGFIHLLCNMAFLWLLGTIGKSFFNDLQITLIFLLSAIGGAVATTWWQVYFSPDSAILVVGASAGVFGVCAACYLHLPRVSPHHSQLAGLLIVNLLLGFILPGVAWYAHIGGAIVGAVMGILYRSFNLLAGNMAKSKLLSDIPDIVDRDRARRSLKTWQRIGKIATPTATLGFLLLLNYFPNINY